VERGTEQLLESRRPSKGKFERGFSQNTYSPRDHASAQGAVDQGKVEAGSETAWDDNWKRNRRRGVGGAEEPVLFPKTVTAIVPISVEGGGP